MGNGTVLKQLPPQIDGIKRKVWLKLLEVSFQDDRCRWELHIDNVLSKASGRMYILRVCKSHGCNLDHLTKLFESLILSLFTYAIEVWGPALLKKHLNRIDKFLARAYRYRYTDTKYDISSIIEQKSKILFSKISNDKEYALYELLPEEREKNLRRCERNFILPQVKTERFKQSYVILKALNVKFLCVLTKINVLLHNL